FARRIPDDCVEYSIFVPNAKNPKQRLSQILQTATNLVKQHTKSYIWHHDPFVLKLTSAQPPSLHGRTIFADSLSDEWFIVYLLLTLSNLCPDAWIRICDTDGEFLLIEASSSLPRWLNPDLAEHRLWLNNGHLRLIPLDTTLPTNLPITSALSFITLHPEKLIISPYIEEEAFFRLRNYPDEIEATFHHAVVSIPRRLAWVIHTFPASISKAIEAFYLRDFVSMKPLLTKDLAMLCFPPEDFVDVSVKFTRVGFAQLRSQVFETPPSWVGVRPRLKGDMKLEVGMKVACGFEMLLAVKGGGGVAAEIKKLLGELEVGKVRLPSDAEIEKWEKREDSEEWLDVDYNELEKELSGKEAKRFGDHTAQENLRRMVDRFKGFLEEEEEGSERDDDDDDDASDESDDEEVKKKEDDLFAKSMKETRGMTAEQIEKSGLLDEARRLALEDADMDVDTPDDEDEEVKKVMAMMDKELKAHGAFDKGPKPAKKPMFGPERPPHMMPKGKEKAVEEEDAEAEAELSSSDDEDYNQVDLNLAKNLLESFKSQTGTSGPAGNMMRALGMNMPRDEG
ncbi:SGT1-domain-containing protein, partial [Piedraia hortae CBS 480.64]